MESSTRISTRFYRGQENTAQTAKEKVKQLADEAAAAAKGGAVSMFKTDPTAPIDVEAGRLDVDDRTKQAVFKSDVRAVKRITTLLFPCDPIRSIVQRLSETAPFTSNT